MHVWDALDTNCCVGQVAWFQFDSNSIPNMSPVLQVLFLVVSVTQLFETMICSPKNANNKQYKFNTFNVSMTLVIFNVFLERTSFL